MTRNAPDDFDELENTDEEEFVGFLETLELATIKNWLEKSKNLVESIKNLEDPIDVIFYLDHLEASIELLNVIEDGELNYELELISSVTNQKRWRQVLQPYVRMTKNERMSLIEKLEAIYDDFTDESLNLSDMHPQEVSSKHRKELAYIVGLLSFFSLAIRDVKGNSVHLEEIFSLISRNESAPQIVRDFCKEELEWGLY